MGHTLTQYVDRIRAALGDLGVLQYVSTEQIPLSLEAAFATFSKDYPRDSSQAFDGNGTLFAFNLTTDITAPAWVPGWSIIRRVEYPAGQRIPENLDALDYHVDPDTGIITFHETTPVTGTANIKIFYSSIWPFPTDVPTVDAVPDLYWHAVASLAASRLAVAKGAEFARRRSASVAGELIQNDPEPLFTAGRILKSNYEETVLGRPTGPDRPAQPVLRHHTIDVFPDTLFHRRTQEAG